MLKEKYLPLVSGWTHSGITCVIFLAAICCRTVASDVKKVVTISLQLSYSYPCSIGILESCEKKRVKKFFYISVV